FELLQPVGDAGVPLVAERLDFKTDLVLESWHVLVTSILVNGNDHVCSEVDDLFEVLRRHVEQVSQARRNALDVPDAGDGRSQLNLPHALPARGGPGDLNATARAHDALEADTLVLATGASLVTARCEDLFAEQTILLGLQRAVVDCLGLLDLTVRPTTDVVSGSQANAKLVKCCYVEQFLS